MMLGMMFRQRTKTTEVVFDKYNFAEAGQSGFDNHKEG